MAAYGSVNWSYEFKGKPPRERVAAAYVSASFFDTLRARALLGRTFLPQEDEPAAGRVLVLSHRLWQRRFGGDPKAIGTTVIADEPFTIVGVMPKGAALGPVGVPGLADVGVDGRTLAFAIAVTLASGILVALAPSWLASRLAIAPTLRSGGAGAGLDRGGLGLTRLLVSAEVALSVVLLVGCGLMVRSLQNLMRIDLGFVPEHALTLSVDFAQEKYPTTGEKRAFQRALVERLASLPGVEAAGAVHNRPLEYGPIGSDNWVIPEGRPLDWDSVSKDSISVNWEAVTPDYFRAVGTRLVEGRAFSERDTPDAPRAVVVSRSLARRGWPGESALGKRLHTYPAKGELKNGLFVDVEWMTVVGVVEDARYRGIQNPRLDVYLPYTQVSDALHVVVRTNGDPLALSGAVRDEVRALDADARVGELTTMQRLVDRALAPWRFASGLLGGFALVALLLTASGLFAVLHHFVSGRTREIAIRMALGADPRRVRRFVLSQGLGVTALGIALGSALSLALARALGTLLYGLDERDPWSHLGGIALIGLVAAAAALVPARRAARVDATFVLRSE